MEGKIECGGWERREERGKGGEEIRNYSFVCLFIKSIIDFSHT